MFVMADIGISYPGLFSIIHSQTRRYNASWNEQYERKVLLDWQRVWSCFTQRVLALLTKWNNILS